MDKINLEKERVSVGDFFRSRSMHCMTSYIRKLPSITRTVEHKRPFRPEVDFKQVKPWYSIKMKLFNADCGTWLLLIVGFKKLQWWWEWTVLCTMWAIACKVVIIRCKKSHIILLEVAHQENKKRIDILGRTVRISKWQNGFYFYICKYWDESILET